MTKLTMLNECNSCKYKNTDAGYTLHLKCTNPDPDMAGEEYAKIRGWFNYPDNFDPAWKSKMCANFEEQQ